jgi:hypothetical protein
MAITKPSTEKKRLYCLFCSFFIFQHVDDQTNMKNSLFILWLPAYVQYKHDGSDRDKALRVWSEICDV